MPASTPPPSAPAADNEIVSSRVFNYPRALVFAAFSDPAQLVLWWGPVGFTNTIRMFDFLPNGAWHITMHSPTGTAYHNESVFREIRVPEKIVSEHLKPIHHFRMTMLYEEQNGQTTLTWRMLFNTAEEVAQLKNFISDANQQNFDRLAAHLATVTAKKKS